MLNRNLSVCVLGYQFVSCFLIPDNRLTSYLSPCLSLSLSLSHVNRVTQYENPVSDAKRRYVGSQLPQRSMAMDDRLPPPLREPPTFQSAAALEKQREAEAAAMWPDAGLSDFPDNYPYQYSAELPPTSEDLEAQLQGECHTVMLPKQPSGFGFTIIGGDQPGELLQVRNILRASVADRDGKLQVGDVLVRINGISVLNYSHQKVVELFQSLPLNSEVTIEVRRGYPLPDIPNELPTYNDSVQNYNSVPTSRSYGAPPPPAPKPEKATVSIVKGPLGFGFSLGKDCLVPQTSLTL